MQNGHIELGLQNANAKKWSRAHLLRCRSINPRRGLYRDALLRSFVCDPATEFQSSGLAATNSRFLGPAIAIFDRYFLVKRYVLKVAPNRQRPEVVCHVPAGVNLHTSPPSFLICREPTCNTPGYGFHPVLYGLTQSVPQCLARVDLFTGACKYVPLSSSVTYMKLVWETFEERIVAISSTRNNTLPFQLAVFDVEPFSLVAIIRLAGHDDFRKLHSAAVATGVLVTCESTRKLNTTLKFFDFERLVREHSIQDAGIQSLLEANDGLFRRRLDDEVLPVTIAIPADYSPFLTVKNAFRFDVDISKEKPYVVMIKEDVGNGSQSTCGQYVLRSFPSGQPALYSGSARPFECEETFAEEGAALDDDCHAIVYQEANRVSLLRYSALPGGAATGCRVEQRYLLDFGTDQETCLPAGGHHQAVHVPYKTRSGRVSRRAVSADSVTQFSESLVKSVYCDADLSLLVVTAASRQSPGTGNVHFYDLASGTLLRTVPLPGWKEECGHSALLLDDCLIHTCTTNDGKQTKYLYFIGRAPVQLCEQQP